ncbi:MAG: alpha-1,2-fucosyltransferase [Eubacteriales bacterium]
MIIINVTGGLGNQLQQYALYEKYKSLGIEAKLDTSWYDVSHAVAEHRELELAYFPNITYDACTMEERKALLCNQNIIKKVIGKVIPGQKKFYPEQVMYNPEIFTWDTMYLEGYWACEAYYGDIMETIREKLTFPHSGNPKNIEVAKKMEDEQSVSIHIRRGDYLRPENAMFSGISTDEYYESAISLIKESMENPIFYIFSDDPAYVRAQYQGEEYRVVDWNSGKDSFFDMYLMSKCKHNICANSTFSFWGARLNNNPDKKMIRPLKQKNTAVYEPETMHKLWKNWILIDEFGTIV